MVNCRRQRLIHCKPRLLSFISPGLIGLHLYLVGFLQHVDQIFGLLDVGDGEKRVSSSGVGCSSGPSDAMDVVLRARWIIEVDDELYVVDVETTGSDVGGDENGRLSTPKLVQHLKD